MPPEDPSGALQALANRARHWAAQGDTARALEAYQRLAQAGISDPAMTREIARLRALNVAAEPPMRPDGRPQARNAPMPQPTAEPPPERRALPGRDPATPNTFLGRVASGRWSWPREPQPPAQAGQPAEAATTTPPAPAAPQPQPRTPTTELPEVVVTAQAPRRQPPARRESEADVLNALELERIGRQNQGLPGAEVSDLWGRPAGYAHGGRVKGARMNRSGRMR
jgi:hypothetical protein